MDAIDRWMKQNEHERLRSRFEAIAATTATGKPTYDQLKVNGMAK